MSFCQVPKLIRQHYLRTWFLVDFLSTVPFDKIVASAYDQNKIRTQLRSIRLIKSLRLFRLIKMVRVIKLGKITESIKGKPKEGRDVLSWTFNTCYIYFICYICYIYLIYSIYMYSIYSIYSIYCISYTCTFLCSLPPQIMRVVN